MCSCCAERLGDAAREPIAHALSGAGARAHVRRPGRLHARDHGVLSGGDVEGRQRGHRDDGQGDRRRQARVRVHRHVRRGVGAAWLHRAHGRAELVVGEEARVVGRLHVHAHAVAGTKHVRRRPQRNVEGVDVARVAAEELHAVALRREAAPARARDAVGDENRLAGEQRVAGVARRVDVDELDDEVEVGDVGGEVQRRGHGSDDGQRRIERRRREDEDVLALEVLIGPLVQRPAWDLEVVAADRANGVGRIGHKGQRRRAGSGRRRQQRTAGIQKVRRGRGHRELVHRRPVIALRAVLVVAHDVEGDVFYVLWHGRPRLVGGVVVRHHVEGHENRQEHTAKERVVWKEGRRRLAVAARIDDELRKAA